METAIRSGIVTRTLQLRAFDYAKGKVNEDSDARIAGEILADHLLECYSLDEVVKLSLDEIIYAANYSDDEEEIEQHRDSIIGEQDGVAVWFD